MGFATEVGIDLGTANLLVTLKGKGIILKEPSVVAIDRKTGNIVATGNEAKEMLGRTPEQIKAVRPLKDGVIADFTATQLMLKNIIEKVENRYSKGGKTIVEIKVFIAKRNPSVRNPKKNKTQVNIVMQRLTSICP